MTEPEPEILKKAKAVKTRKTENSSTDDHAVLAAAWLKDEITMRQAAVALGDKHTTNVLHKFAYAFKRLYKQNKIQIL